MKILLIDPPGKNKGLNTGLAYLSAILLKDHQIRVLDLNNIEMGLCGDANPEISINELDNRIIEAVDDFSPDMLGVSVKTFTAEITRHIISFIKGERSNITTIVGGPHITLNGSKFIDENNINFGIHGEGEYSTYELCDALDGKRRIEDVAGLSYRANGKLVQNQQKERIKDLDALPFPNYEQFSSVRSNGGYLKEYPILTSRGCPYHCSYCSMPKIMGSKWRFQTPIRVIKEIKQAKQKYGCKSFTVIDDNFTLNLDRVENICELLVSEKINLPWNSQNGIRADRIDNGLARKMKRSGCQYVWIGIESADEEVFKSIDKGEKLEDIKSGIKHLRDAGIKVGGFFITGLPHSTREADLKSIDFVKDQNIDGWWFNFIPYPHTKAWRWVQNNGNILRSINGALQYGEKNIEPVFETKDYSKESRIKTYEEIHIRLSYFDRLVDQELSQRQKWSELVKKVRPYGIGKLIMLSIFMLKHNAVLIKEKILSLTKP